MRLFIAVIVLGFGIYTAPVDRPRLVVDECAPGFEMNPPDYNPPCIALPRFRGQGLRTVRNGE